MQHLALAKKAAARIQAEPSSFDMGTWGSPAVARLFGFRFRRPARFRACLAGHILIADGYRINRNSFFVRGRATVPPAMVPVIAKELIGINVSEYSTAYPGHRHFDACNLFCARASRKEALDRFLQLIETEEQRRLVSA